VFVSGLGDKFVFVCDSSVVENGGDLKKIFSLGDCDSNGNRFATNESVENLSHGQARFNFKLTRFEFSHEVIDLGVAMKNFSTGNEPLIGEPAIDRGESFTWLHLENDVGAFVIPNGNQVVNLT